MPKNIVLLMMDQLRPDHVSFLPGGRLVTPGLARVKYVHIINPTPFSLTGEDPIFDLMDDPDELNNRAAEPAYAEELARCREHLQRLMDTTPADQTGWAPFGTSG